MNDGIYGFPPGPPVTVDVQFFETSGFWYKPKNAKICFVDGTGGGGAGAAGAKQGAGGAGGSAGVAYQITIRDVGSLKSVEAVIIGAGGIANGGTGGDTEFANMIWMGGLGAGAVAGANLATARTIFFTNNPFIPFGSAGRNTGNTPQFASAQPGNFGAGGGGAGGNWTNANMGGGFGSSPRNFFYKAYDMGGAQGGSSNGGDGVNSNPLNDVYDYGEGAGGGGSNQIVGGNGGKGGTGRRGSGGGGGGGGENAGGNGGDGGGGFLRIITYCWE